MHTVITSGVTSNRLIVSGGDTADVLSGGALTTAFDYGYIKLEHGGRATNTTVSDETVSSNGFSTSYSGSFDVYGIAVGTILGGATETVFHGGVESGGRVGASSLLTISSGGSVLSATIVGDGEVFVHSGGKATGLTVKKGDLKIDASALLSGDLVSSGGTMTLEKPVIVSGVVSAARTEAATNRVSGASLLSGGTLDLSDAIVLSGGADHIISGGTASATTVSAGGKEVIGVGGLASATHLSSGGTQIVSSGGIARATFLDDGSVADVWSGGTLSVASLQSGGRVVDDGVVTVVGSQTLGGSLAGSGEVIKTGGRSLSLYASGSTFHGLAVISGGGIELAAADALGTGAVVFAAPNNSAAILQVDAADSPRAGVAFKNTLSGFMSFGDRVDVRGIAFHSGASATVSGSQLLLTDGGETYKFNLAGTHAAAYQVVGDGSTGTEINVLVAGFAQAIAGRGAAAAASVAPVSASAAGSTIALFNPPRSEGPHH